MAITEKQLIWNEIVARIFTKTNKLFSYKPWKYRMILSTSEDYTKLQLPWQ